MKEQISSSNNKSNEVNDSKATDSQQKRDSTGQQSTAKDKNKLVITSETSDTLPAPTDEKLLPEDFKNRMAEEWPNVGQSEDKHWKTKKTIFEVTRVIFICVLFINSMMLIGGAIFCIAEPEKFREDVKQSEPIRMLSILYDLFIDSEHMVAYTVFFFGLDFMNNSLSIVAVITANKPMNIICTIFDIPFCLSTYSIPALLLRTFFCIILFLGWNKRNEDKSDDRAKNMLDKLNK